MLTPSRYWRIAQTVEDLSSDPPREFTVPENLSSQTKPPAVGDGLLLAAYDNSTNTGLIGHMGLVTGRIGTALTVNWRATRAEIWVDTPAGRGFWTKQPGFCFARSKIPGYGLHQLFMENFEGLTLREVLPGGVRSPVGPHAAATRGRGGSSERLNPVEIIGEPTQAARGGYVYVLKSAFGCKVGRTRNVPSRMRTFGVKLPIVYTIPLCAWFDDHIAAETAYHRLFGDKRINGEWFDLSDDDVGLIRSRSFGPGSNSAAIAGVISRP
ncbi:GIY-YIG nuclease family protein [Variovorax boronicumulans]|uniref:GIY-YIG nuclease family protein n=1 Tax=Variovorax boronicumulans TaxID=436515 RepID=UPI000782EDDA|nr:GIY-YIG nuclease family protein [Variovorax boronicumulans]